MKLIEWHEQKEKHTRQICKRIFVCFTDKGEGVSDEKPSNAV